VRLQRWDRTAREFLLQRVTLARGATLTMVNLTLGSAVSKAHTITKLLGEHATTQLSGFVFGQGHQHVDQHTVQDHQAPHTSSDLQFRAALQDHSRVIYTGLIRIAKAAKQTNAFQANHNLLLSQTAKAETIPMLEILADDVQCKHGASIGPIDEEQLFYLRARGILRAHAERLIVMGFVESIIQQVPFEPLQQRLREAIEGHLHQETSQQG
jgi:Fe-S cluster assembly protein SufD